MVSLGLFVWLTCHATLKANQPGTPLFQNVETLAPLLKVGFIQDCPVKHRVLAAVLKDFKRLIAASATGTRRTCVLSQCFCQAQPTPSSNWDELPLFSLSTAYGQDGLRNITYGLYNIAFGLHNPTYELHSPACGLHNPAYGLHNIGKVIETVS